MSDAPPGGFRLQHRGRSVHLRVGEYLVGRGSECDMVIDDPLVSRKHACFRVSPERVVVDDLGSKNGIRVNGLPVTEPTRLKVGDLVTIGAHQLVLRAGEDTPGPSLKDWLASAEAMSMSETQPESRASNAVSLLVDVTERAFATGDLGHAARVVRSMVQSVRSHFAHGASIAPDTMLSAAEQALSLADRTGSPQWIDSVFEMYGAAEMILDVVLIDQLQDLCRRVGYQPCPAMDDYLEGMRRDPSRLTTYHRFLLDRLQDLRRSLVKAEPGA